VLYIVLALVLAAFGLLIGALTTANTLWAWISVVVSVVAAALLIMDWIKGRRARTAAPARRAVTTVGGSRRRADEPDDSDEPDEFDDDFAQGDLLVDEDFPRQPEPLTFEPPVKVELPGGPDDVRTVVTEAVEPPADRAVAADRAVGGASHRVDEADDGDDYDVEYDAADAGYDASEPGEEPTDASDLLVVAGLNVEVRVVDEHPRYHLATCVWLANRPTIPIPVSEARQLGFTPCARCGPDAVLAARHRAAR
jgi:hypothetical protein